MYKWLHNRSMPKWLKIVLYILITLSLVYLIGLITYRVLEGIRWLLHNATDKKFYWITLTIILIATIVVLVVFEKFTDIDPFSNLIRYIVTKWQEFRNWVASLISG